MPYTIGAKGSYGCAGYPAVKDDGTVMGCHTSREAAARQIYAINQSEGNVNKGIPNLTEGDWAMTGHGSDKFHIGRVIHVMRDGALGIQGDEYYIEASAENPAVMIQLYEQDDEGWWEATRLYTACMMSMMIQIDPLPTEPTITDVDMSMNTMKSIVKSVYRVDANNAACSGNFAVVDEEGEIEGCFDTREQANAFMEAKNKEERMDDMEDMMEMDKSRTMANAPYQDNTAVANKAKPNYGEMIQPRRGGSTPDNPRLYARIVQEAKDKFDVYPSAVANGWVVQEYKRRGGTYKMYDKETEKREFSSATRERMAEAGTAMPDGSFPIANRSDLQNAIQAVGRARDYAAARAHIIRRARALNAVDMLPEDWRNSATKGMTEWSGSIFDLNPFVK